MSFSAKRAATSESLLPSSITADVKIIGTKKRDEEKMDL
jgi:hypothetical protein